MLDYRKLKVWQKAHKVALDIIELLKEVPNQPGLDRIVDQIVGSASSVGANIAEGKFQKLFHVFPDPAEAETTVYFGRSSAKSWSFSRMVDIGERTNSRTI
jgi:hypothetical protein